ncbi:MAG: VOC family protein [Chromatiales bacterium]|nr:VOC family protein [Chromatiales bacterium]
MKPNFKPGKNIAIKVPAHEFEKTVNFYKAVLGLKQIDVDSPDQFDSVAFEFGDKNLWVDKISGISQAEIWLEIETDNAVEAKKYLEGQGCAVRDEIEPLPPTLNGFWLSSPSNIIHLVVE